MTTDTAVAEVTVSTAVPEIGPELAVIVELPLATASAKPAVGGVLLTVATAVFEEVHVTLLVMFRVLLSVYVPVAVNCCVVLAAIGGLTGVTTIETRPGATVTSRDPLTEPDVAITEHDPPVFTLSMPPVAIEQMFASDELHVAVAVRSCELLLL